MGKWINESDRKDVHGWQNSGEEAGYLLHPHCQSPHLPSGVALHPGLAIIHRAFTESREPYTMMLLGLFCTMDFDAS